MILCIICICVAFLYNKRWIVCRHVDPYESYRPSALHDSENSSEAGTSFPRNDNSAGTRFSRNVPVRRTVHTVPLSVYQSPRQRGGEISPASTPQCSNLRCGTSTRSHADDGHPSFFGRLAAKLGRKRYPILIISSDEVWLVLFKDIL